MENFLKITTQLISSFYDICLPSQCQTYQTVFIAPVKYNFISGGSLPDLVQ